MIYSGILLIAVRAGRVNLDHLNVAHMEVVRLHDFLGAWFRGEEGKDTFAASFADVLHDEFENIQPAGAILKRSDLIEQVWNGHGTNPNFQISIEEPRLLGYWPDLLLFQYVELQTGARSSAPENRRLSTVLFEVANEGFFWRYLTEVGLDVATAASS